MPTPVLLAVDDDPAVRAALLRDLRDHYDRDDVPEDDQYEIITTASGPAAIDVIVRLQERRQPVALVLSDERMPGMTGSQFLTEVRKQWPNTIRMILSGQADLEAAVRAINEGEVYRFLLKPCHPKELQMTILQGLQQKKLVAQSRKLLQEHQKNVNILETLEKDNPGITKIELDEDGAIMMDEDAGATEDVQSLLDDLEREMAKVARR